MQAWQQLGLPEKVQFDNGKEFCGFGRWPGSLSRVIRLCLRLQVEPVFIPEGSPQRNGSVEHFNGWFQPRLLERRFQGAAKVRRELRRLQETVNERHVHPQLGYQSAAKYRCSKRLRKLPAHFRFEGQPLPVCAGKVSFIRLVSARGTINILGQVVKISKRLKFQYVRATLTTEARVLKVYHNGRLIKRLSCRLRNK